jgi:hypothetical protein
MRVVVHTGDFKGTRHLSPFRPDGEGKRGRKALSQFAALCGTNPCATLQAAERDPDQAERNRRYSASWAASVN